MLVHAILVMEKSQDCLRAGEGDRNTTIVTFHFSVLAISLGC